MASVLTRLLKLSMTKKDARRVSIGIIIIVDIAVVTGRARVGEDIVVIRENAIGRGIEADREIERGIAAIGLDIVVKGSKQMTTRIMTWSYHILHVGPLPGAPACTIAASYESHKQMQYST